MDAKAINNDQFNTIRTSTKIPVLLDATKPITPIFDTSPTLPSYGTTWSVSNNPSGGSGNDLGPAYKEISWLEWLDRLSEALDYFLYSMYGLMTVGLLVLM